MKNSKQFYGLASIITLLLIVSFAGLNSEYITDNLMVSEESADYNGTEIFQAETENWTSYSNPRDRFHPDYHEDGVSVPDRIMNELRPGSGKYCMTLLNEANQPITGKTLENTSAEMNIEGLEWHPLTQPFTVNYPLEENYDRRPMDGDQFGTSDERSQGDGVLDSHCIEFHLAEENLSTSYSPVSIEGKESDAVEVVGYREKKGYWNSDIDPVDDVWRYGENQRSDGEISMNENQTHFQVVAVLKLTRNENLITETFY